MLGRLLPRYTALAAHQAAATALCRPLATYAQNICEVIGSTPMVKLNKVPGPECKATVLMKLEMQNPGGSIKDRIALSMIEEAEKRGEIHPSRTTIVEGTSGNTGIGIAMVCAAKGYKCIIVMPQVPAMYERYMTCRKLGAEVHLTSVIAGEGVDFAKNAKNFLGYAKQLANDNENYWSPTQFESDDNPLAHVETTGPEIWDQTDGEVDVIVAGAGTGGTINGLARYFKEKKPSVQIVCVEPTESRVLQGETAAMHGVVGIGAGITLPLLEKLAPGSPFVPGPRKGTHGGVDEFLSATTPECIQWANRCAKEEGIMVGPSSGAVVKCAVDIANRPGMEGKTVVAIQASNAIRYVAHPMWAEDKAEATEALPVPPNIEDEFPILRWSSKDYVPPPK